MNKENLEKSEEAWNENVETCSGCGIHWKKIGKQCEVCYAPPENLTPKASIKRET